MERGGNVTCTLHVRVDLGTFMPAPFYRRRESTPTLLFEKIFGNRAIDCISLFLVCSFCPLYTSEEKGKKTGSRNYVSSSETCCVCASLSHLAFLSQ